MGRRAFVLLPRIEKLLKEFGEDIKLARLRRKLSAEAVAERAGISRPTLRGVEGGSPSVTLGAYTQVLMVLGLEQGLRKVAEADELGRRLQDASMQVKERAPKRKQ
jgi:transcriptional regulator with XRE-family HTH domain